MCVEVARVENGVHDTQRYFSLAVWYFTHEPAHSSTGLLSSIFKMKLENEIEKVSPHSLWSHPVDIVEAFPSSSSKIYQKKKKSLLFIGHLKNSKLNVINFSISSVKISVFQESLACFHKI